MTAFFTKALPDLVKSHAYHYVFNAATLLVAAVLMVLLIETEVLRARRPDGAVGRAWFATTLPLALVFVIALVVRLHRYG